MVDTKHKRCCHPVCDTRPTYDKEGGKGRFCKVHAEPGMLDVGSKRCSHPGCYGYPVYNKEGGKACFCKAHAESGMVNVKSKRCCHPGCDTQPSYDREGGKGRFCKAHAEPEMVNVVSKRCCHPGCDTQPFYGKERGKGRFCKAHAELGMVDVKSKRCCHPGCDTIPGYDKEGGKGRFCKAHAEHGMLDVKSKRCCHPGCYTQAWYGLPGHKPSVCAQHRQPGMLRKPNAKCKHPNCKESAMYGKYLEPRRCESHKLADDQNLVEQECVSCHLPMVLNAEHLCEFCKPEAFERAALAKQRRVMAYLDANNLTGTSTDRIVDGGVCGKERPDRMYELPDRVIIVEVDENQHRDRTCECEQTRMVNVSQSFGGLPTFWIRFNPDEYKPARAVSQQKTVEDRLKTLVKTLQHTLANTEKPHAFVQVLHLYFNGWKESQANMWEVLVPWDKL